MDSNIWGIRYGASTKSNHQVPQDVIALVLTYCCHPYQCLSLRFVSTLSETDPFVAHAVDLTQENPTGGTDLCFKLQIFNDWFRELRSFVNNCQSMWCILSIGTRFFFIASAVWYQKWYRNVVRPSSKTPLLKYIFINQVWFSVFPTDIDFNLLFRRNWQHWNNLNATFIDWSKPSPI